MLTSNVQFFEKKKKKTIQKNFFQGFASICLFQDIFQRREVRCSQNGNACAAKSCKFIMRWRQQLPGIASSTDYRVLGPRVNSCWCPIHQYVTRPQSMDSTPRIPNFQGDPCLITFFNTNYFEIRNSALNIQINNVPVPCYQMFKLDVGNFELN